MYQYKKRKANMHNSQLQGPQNLLTPQAVSVFVVTLKNDIPHYLAIRRCSNFLNGNWQMVSGGLETGETAPQGALRELKEETGLTPERMYSADFIEMFYEMRSNKIWHIPVFVAFVPEDSVITLSPSEHDTYKWLTYEEMLRTLEFRSQREALIAVHANSVCTAPNEFFRISNI